MLAEPTELEPRDQGQAISEPRYKGGAEAFRELAQFKPAACLRCVADQQIDPEPSFAQVEAPRLVVLAQPSELLFGSRYEALASDWISA